MAAMLRTAAITSVSLAQNISTSTVCNIQQLSAHSLSRWPQISCCCCSTRASHAALVGVLRRSSRSCCDTDCRQAERCSRIQIIVSIYVSNAMTANHHCPRAQQMCWRPNLLDALSRVLCSMLLAQAKVSHSSVQYCYQWCALLLAPPAVPRVRSCSLLLV